MNKLRPGRNKPRRREVRRTGEFLSRVQEAGIIVQCYCGRSLEVTRPEFRFIACARCGFVLEKQLTEGKLILKARKPLCSLGIER